MNSFSNADQPLRTANWIMYPIAPSIPAMKAIEIVPPTIAQMTFQMMSEMFCIVSIMLLFNVVLILYYKDTTKK